MPYFWKSKTLLAKIEVTYGTDSVPTAAANAILASNVTLAPMEGEDVRRNVERPFFGAQEELPVGLHCMLTFDVELQGSGALGVAPGWGPLIRMCSVAQVVTAATRVEYTPITDAPESGAIYMAIDTVRHVLLGARGTFVITLNAQGIPVKRYTMTGLFTVPTTVAKVTPTLTGFQAPLVATRVNTPTFTIGGTAMILRSLEFNRGADVQKRFLIGFDGILIVNAEEALKVTVEAPVLGTYNPYTIAQARTLQPIALAHGTVAGFRVKLDFAQAQQKRLSGLEPNQDIVEYPLDFVPQPSAGNDQWKITLD